ncbi:MAG TPA: hypothetical protein VFU63_14780 [Ktedonobacterales bacterium]|nr:hypothetical protein [Ktedonobacterales bacterium]
MHTPLDGGEPGRIGHAAVPISTISLLAVTAALLGMFVIMSAAAPVGGAEPAGIQPLPTWTAGPVLTTAPGVVDQPTAAPTSSPSAGRAPTAVPRARPTATATIAPTPTLTPTAAPSPTPPATPVSTQPVGGG